MTPLTGEQLLERGLGDRVEMTTRPRPTPREVLAAWLGNFGVGVGAGVVAGVGLYALGAPDAWLIGGALGTGAVAFGCMMMWHGSIDERADWRNVRQVKRAVKMIAQEYEADRKQWHAEKEALLDAIDNDDAEIQQWKRAYDGMTRERDMAIYDLTNERRNAAQRAACVIPLSLPRLGSRGYTGRYGNDALLLRVAGASQQGQVQREMAMER